MNIRAADYIRFRIHQDTRFFIGRVLKVQGDHLTVEFRRGDGKFTTLQLSSQLVTEVLPWFDKISHRDEYSPFIHFHGQGYHIIKKVRVFFEENILKDPRDLPIACRFFLENSLQAMTPAGPRISFVHFGYNLVFTLNRETGKINDVCFLNGELKTHYPLSFFEYQGMIGTVSKHATDMLHVRKHEEIKSYAQHLSRCLATAEECSNESVNLGGKLKRYRFFKNKNYDLVLVLNEWMTTIITVYPYQGSIIQLSEMKESA